MRSGSEGAGAGSTFRHSGWRPLPLRAQQDLNLRVDVEKGSVSKFVQPPRRPASHDESSTRTRRKVPTGTLDDVAIVEHLSMARAKLCNSIRALMAQAPSEAEQQPCEGCMSTTRLNECVIMPCGRKIRLCCPCARLYGRMLTARLAQVKADNALVTAKSSPLPKLPQEHATAPVLNLGLGGSFEPTLKRIQSDPPYQGGTSASGQGFKGPSRDELYRTMLASGGGSPAPCTAPCAKQSLLSSQTLSFSGAGNAPQGPTSHRYPDPQTRAAYSAGAQVDSNASSASESGLKENILRTWKFQQGQRQTGRDSPSRARSSRSRTPDPVGAGTLQPHLAAISGHMQPNRQPYINTLTPSPGDSRMRGSPLPKRKPRAASSPQGGGGGDPIARLLSSSVTPFGKNISLPSLSSPHSASGGGEGPLTRSSSWDYAPRKVE